MIGDASLHQEIDPFLLAAVAVRESGMNPLAAGAAGERGIVQLHPRVTGARVLFVRSESYRHYCEHQPGVCQDEVLEAGARLLARSIDHCGSVRDALGAYNRGECGETDYSRRVMSERQHLLRLAKADDASLATIN
jgi:membrane-bound lytic murein transglycosylase MltF